MARTTITGTVLHVQHLCARDGPGVRSTIFLKGCPLRCKWCSNPESIRPQPELAYDVDLCVGAEACGACVEACPESAIFVLPSDGRVRIAWDACTDCGDCIAVCPPGALHPFGRETTVDEVLAEVERGRALCREPGGGVTLSGGECLTQPDFCAAVLEEARRRGLDTAIETAGNVPWAAMEKVLPHADTVLHDFKLMDPERHRRWVGVDNARILDNYRRAYDAFPRTTFVARTPIVPGVNDDEAHVRAVLAFIRPRPNVVDLELVPYRRFADEKYAFLGRVHGLDDFASPATADVNRLQRLVDEAFATSRGPGHNQSTSTSRT
jgi:pyruvate formate lyase activating enzyme